jgi:hypothetical protein
MIDQGLIRVIDYKDWIQGGFTGEYGHVELILRALKFCIIKPRRFPEKRLIAQLGDFEEQRLPNPHLALQNGSLVEFDLDGQEIKKGRLPEVSCCRLVFPKDSQ